MDGGVLGVRLVKARCLTAIYPIDANSIGSSPSSSRVDDYSAMVVDLSKNSNITYIFLLL